MSDTITEFGDFQTPLELASRICRLLAANGHAPRSVLEPTCGVGGFVEAASIVWPEAGLSGVEINPEYVVEADRKLSERAAIQQGDFFTFEWSSLLERQIQPILVVGNLPWVTNAKVGSIGGSNLPEKSNFKNHKGFDAITGKSNFDISEWMLIQMLSWFTSRNITLALLCKSAVARKALTHAWKCSIPIRSAIYRIDAKKEFNVSVDACLLIVEASSKEVLDCPVFPDLDAAKPQQTIGYRQQHLISEVSAYENCRPFNWDFPVQVALWN